MFELEAGWAVGSWMYNTTGIKRGPYAVNIYCGWRFNPE